MKTKRRSILKIIGSTSLVGVTGCVSSVGTESDTNSSDTASKNRSTQTKTMSNSRTLSYTATVIEQQTSSAPARVKSTLKNVRSEAIQIFLGPTLMFSDNSGGFDWPNEIIIAPDVSGVKLPGKKVSNKGCWRYMSDSEPVVQSSLQTKKIKPDDSISEIYKLYTKGESRPCLPEGEYVFRDEISVGNESKPVVLNLQVHIDGNQNISAEASLEE